MPVVISTYAVSHRRSSVSCALGGALALTGVLLSCSPPAPGPGERDVRARFEELHRRLYDVYSLDADRDALWDFLAQSFAGEALTGEYVEHFTVLHRMARERTAIRVLEVDYEDVTIRRAGRDVWVDAD